MNAHLVSADWFLCWETHKKMTWKEWPGYHPIVVSVAQGYPCCYMNVHLVSADWCLCWETHKTMTWKEWPGYHPIVVSVAQGYPCFFFFFFFNIYMTLLQLKVE